jgi:hypothetical protein
MRRQSKSISIAQEQRHDTNVERICSAVKRCMRRCTQASNVTVGRRQGCSSGTSQLLPGNLAEMQVVARCADGRQACATISGSDLRNEAHGDRHPVVRNVCNAVGHSHDIGRSMRTCLVKGVCEKARWQGSRLCRWAASAPCAANSCQVGVQQQLGQSSSAPVSHFTTPRGQGAAKRSARLEGLIFHANRRSTRLSPDLTNLGQQFSIHASRATVLTLHPPKRVHFLSQSIYPIISQYVATAVGCKVYR